jgi:SecD/SecF fusion protein
VKGAILDALGKELKLELPSTYDHYDDGLQAAINDKAIVPVEKLDQAFDGFSPPSTSRYLDGAAIILENIQPALTPNQIRDRINWQRVQPSTEKSSTNVYRDFTVEAPGNDGTKPATRAVILVGDPLLPYSKDQAKWRDDLAAPMWNLTQAAINKPPQLQRVSNFDAAVAGDTTNDALMALGMSVVVILAYIWLRFGNLRYGTATVVAMLHDTVLVVGFVGLSHYLGHTAVGRFLLIEPVRVNLTIVAAVLTVMSYSMIDTIVVFDRVREIRGKYGLLSRKVINDAVNQTLSRTLLTVGTTMATVAVMYFFGGSGIHGFTFVLLIGILVGSYSSIAIAAPILLVRAKQDDGSGGVGSGQTQVKQLQTAGR